MSMREFTPGRVEAFSDGVIAIIITIMVLELHAPHSADPSVLLELWPTFLSYFISFVMVAIYWMNHHHLFHQIKMVNDRILWANTALLFTLSLVPFFTAYIGDTEFSSFSVAIYSAVMLACGLCFSVLTRAMGAQLKENPRPGTDSSATRKNLIGIALYAIAIVLAFVNPYLALGINAVVAALFVVPRLFLDVA